MSQQQVQQQQPPPDQLSSAFPAPPAYYQFYTSHNLALPVSERPRNLDPPSLASITEKEGITLFGTYYPNKDKLKSLSDLGIQQLYSSNSANNDRVQQELLKLSNTLLTTYLRLLETLTTNPKAYPGDIDAIKLVLINMHHLFNEYRPHQARDTLRLWMKRQIEEKREMAQRIRQVCRGVEKVVNSVEIVSEVKVEDADVVKGTKKNSSSNNNNEEHEDDEARQRRIQDLLEKAYSDLLEQCMATT